MFQPQVLLIGFKLVGKTIFSKSINLLAKDRSISMISIIV